MADVFQISVSAGGVPKNPVTSARITATGVSGDAQSNLEIHGGPERAVCLYSLECLQALQAEGHPILPGSTGENLTFRGLDWAQVALGSRISVGDSAVLEVTRYASPCRKIRAFFLDGDFMRISQSTHPGWSRAYARVLIEGSVRTGDPVHMLSEGSPSREGW